MRYRGYTIIYDPPPIPVRKFDWNFWHDDYDGQSDGRCGCAASVKACFAEIDEIEGGERCYVCDGAATVEGTKTYTKVFGDPSSMVTETIQYKCPACNGTGSKQGESQ